jgi:hypothetical protein
MPFSTALNVLSARRDPAQNVHSAQTEPLPPCARLDPSDAQNECAACAARRSIPNRHNRSTSSGYATPDASINFA